MATPQSASAETIQPCPKIKGEVHQRTWHNSRFVVSHWLVNCHSIHDANKKKGIRARRAMTKAEKNDSSRFISNKESPAINSGLAVFGKLEEGTTFGMLKSGDRSEEHAVIHLLTGGLTLKYPALSIAVEN